jgi:large subunit ribosomal protein L31e
MAEKESGKEIERIYVIPLTTAKHGRSSLAAPRAVKHVRQYLMKHMKVDEDNVWIDDSVNRNLWAHGKFKIPSKIRVRAVKFEDGVVEATIPEMGVKKSRREILKEEKEKKTPILKREEVEAASGEGAAGGTQDYDITPTSDGDVKIKKKKEEKPKEIEEPVKKEKKPKAKPKKPAEEKEEKKPKTASKKEKTSVKKKSSSKKAAKKSE